MESCFTSSRTSNLSFSLADSGYLFFGGGMGLLPLERKGGDLLPLGREWVSFRSRGNWSPSVGEEGSSFHWGGSDGIGLLFAILNARNVQMGPHATLLL